jgi:hypothetical protein
MAQRMWVEVRGHGPRRYDESPWQTDVHGAAGHSHRPVGRGHDGPPVGTQTSLAETRAAVPGQDTGPHRRAARGHWDVGRNDCVLLQWHPGDMEREMKKEDSSMDLIFVPKLLFGITAVVVALVLLVLKEKS